MTESKITTAVIGCGHWGKNLSRNFAELESLKYVCDTSTKQVIKIAKI